MDTKDNEPHCPRCGIVTTWADPPPWECTQSGEYCVPCENALEDERARAALARLIIAEERYRMGP